ncbi:glycerophosphodiester phosphodiesterase 1 [Trichuris trichiura]|uniref:Glycerophosphodiester phosphodiesterase 1 n=1 Tax=Trichuris trichiura TaxID=36087 RepID=A0A077Z5D3_TRITR|nr:glycerophosphodiester phosphodiesterase 1 [Trichuris trichiura]
MFAQRFCWFAIFMVQLSTTVIVMIVFGCKIDGNAERSLELSFFLKNLKAGAHRGLSLDAPENTLAAIKFSKALEADLVEVDVSLTADGTAVLMHDETVDRTTNGSGRIASMTDKEVATLNAAAKFRNGTAFGFEKVPSLKEAALLVVELNMKMIIDVKWSDQRTINAIVELYNENPSLYRTAAVSSFHPMVAVAIERLDPMIITGHTWCAGMFSQKSCNDRKRRYDNNMLHYVLVIFERLYIRLLHDVVARYTGADLMLVERQSISKRYVDDMKHNSINVIAWTVNDPLEKEYYSSVLVCPYLTDTMENAKRRNEELSQPAKDTCSVSSCENG